MRKVIMYMMCVYLWGGCTPPQSNQMEIASVGLFVSPPSEHINTPCGVLMGDSNIIWRVKKRGQDTIVFELRKYGFIPFKMNGVATVHSGGYCENAIGESDYLAGDSMVQISVPIAAQHQAYYLTVRPYNDLAPDMVYYALPINE